MWQPVLYFKTENGRTWTEDKMYSQASQHWTTNPRLEMIGTPPVVVSGVQETEDAKFTKAPDLFAQQLLYDLNWTVKGTHMWVCPESISYN